MPSFFSYWDELLSLLLGGLFLFRTKGKIIKDDFVYLHVEASDEAGHEGNFELKQLTIENLDKRVVGPIYNAVKDWDEPVAIAILPDHPTPCKLRTHTDEAVPFLIYYPGIEADSVKSFDEIASKDGSYGVMKEDEFMNEFMSSDK